MATGFMDCPQAMFCICVPADPVLACQKIEAAANGAYHAFSEQTEDTSTPMAVLLRRSPVRAARESCTNLVFQIFPAVIVKQLMSPQ